MTIQTQVLALSAIAEGLHRKLFSDPARAKRVPAISKQARDAARDAAVAELAGDEFTDDDRAESCGRVEPCRRDRAEFGQAVSQALEHVWPGGESQRLFEEAASWPDEPWDGSLI